MTRRAISTSPVKRIIRWLRCRLKWCPGRIECNYENGALHVGWRCLDCGQLKGWQPVMPRKTVRLP